MENLSLMKSEIVWKEEECHENMLSLKEEICELEETPASFGYAESLEQDIEEEYHENKLLFQEVNCKLEEIPASLSYAESSEQGIEEECHENLLPLKEENLDVEETLASLDYAQSSEQDVEENVSSSEEMQFAFVKCEEDWDWEVHNAEVLDLNEDTTENENTLKSPLKEAVKLPPSGPKSQGLETVPQASCTGIGATYYCKPCDEEFQGQLDFNSHIAKTHKKMDCVQCPYCEKNFRFQSNLLKHVLCHSKLKPFPCKICDRQFTSSGDLERHIVTHSDVNLFKCMFCDSKFRYIGHLDRYKCMHHTRPINTNLECIPVLNDHINGNSSTSEPVDESDLSSNQHRADITISKHFCYQCSELFNSKEELKSHIFSIHSRQREFKITYQCPDCPKSFSYPSKLMEHVVTHSANGRRACIICNETFSLRKHLLNHMKEHISNDTSGTTKEIRVRGSLKGDYPCKYCGKIYLWPSRLDEHIVKHTREKRYTCTVCNKTFTTKSGLKYHLEKHTGDMSYSCPFCKKKFSRNSEVKYHMAKHVVLPKNPQVCG